MTQAQVLHDKQIHQGDIFTNIDYIERAEIIDGRVEISKIRFPYVIVLSQECDLKQDYVERGKDEAETIIHDKLLQSIIVAPMFNYEHFRAGEHLSNLGYTMANDYNNQTKTMAKVLVQNNNPRYHYLKFDAGISLVPMTIDFKRFTVDISLLYRHKSDEYICSLNPLFRERLSQRFANFYRVLACQITDSLARRP